MASNSNCTRVKKRTYIDTCVAIAAFRGTNTDSIDLLQDANRVLVVSDLLAFELFPKACFNEQTDEQEFYQLIFENAIVKIKTTPKILNMGYELACLYGMSAFDALHIAAAYEAQADEFVTLEKPEHAFSRIEDMKVISLYSKKP